MGEQQGILKENKREKIIKRKEKQFFLIKKYIYVYLQEFLWSCYSQCGFSSISDSSSFQLTRLDIYRPGVVGVTYRDFNLLHWSFLKWFPLFIWLLFALSWCLLSALTQAGGGDLLFRFASSVQSCYGEDRVLQTDIAVCGQHSVFRPHWVCPIQGCLCFPHLHCSGFLASLYGAGPALSAVPVFMYSTKAQIRLRLHFVPSPA